MLERAHIHHELPSRLRLYIPSKRKDVPFFEHLQQVLGECDEVDGVVVNAATGSVVIHHHGTVDELAKFAKHHHLFQIEPKRKAPIEVQRPPAARIASRLRKLNHTITKHSNGQFDLGFLTACGLVALAFFQAGNRRVLPPAWTLISQALSVIQLVANGSLSKLVTDITDEE